MRMCGRRARCFYGSSPCALFKTWLLINIPTTFYNCAIAASPVWQGNTRWVLLVLGLLLQILTNVLMLRTSCRDPGVIPATWISDEAYMKLPLRYVNIFFKEQRVQYLQLQGKAAYGAEATSAAMARLKYCEACAIFRPQKAAHCNECNNCVRDFDHHCPWLGTCVGANNYSSFFAFIVSLTSLCVTMLVTCIC